MDAANALLKIAAQACSERMYHSGVIVLRYVAASPGFLSMRPNETCMIELPMLRDVFGSDTLPWLYEKELTENFGARPNWGQRNFLTGSREMLERLYDSGNLSNWLEVFRWFNPKGEFQSVFTDRVGFSSHLPNAQNE